MNKLLVVILSFPAVIYAYFDINSEYQDNEWDFPHEYLLYIGVALLIVIIVTILTMNTISFVNSQKVNRIRFLFKRDLFECIKEQLPEIKGFCYYKKIHPKYFHDSGLYTSTHSDYIGDDLFYGEYKGYPFEICELHVFSIFKQIFDGLFIRIYVNKSLVINDNPNVCKVEVPKSLQVKHSIRSGNKNFTSIYIAVNKRGKLFEQTDLREIEELKDEITMLTEVVNLTKAFINSIN